MPNGYGGRGFGRRGGWGFGFRGSSPPWPYVGLGRGGLPRCGYFFSGAAGVSVPPAAYGYDPFYGAPAPTPLTREQELDFLKNQAEAIRGQLEQIDTRIKELETEER